MARCMGENKLIIPVAWYDVIIGVPPLTMGVSGIFGIRCSSEYPTISLRVS